MAQSKCPACSNTRFENKTIEPSGSRFKLTAVQCTQCGSVVGVTEYLNIGAAIEALQTDVAKLTRTVNQIEHFVLELVNRV